MIIKFYARKFHAKPFNYSTIKRLEITENICCLSIRDRARDNIYEFYFGKTMTAFLRAKYPSSCKKMNQKDKLSYNNKQIQKNKNNDAC